MESSVVPTVVTPDAELLAVSILDTFIKYGQLVVCVCRPPLGNFSAFFDIVDLFLPNHPLTQNTTILADFNRFDTQDRELYYGLKKRIHFNTRGNVILDQILSDVNNYQET